MGGGVRLPLFPTKITPMTRHKVPRLRQAFTIQGMSLGDILLTGLLFYLGWRITGLILGHPGAKLLGAFLTFYLGMGFYRNLMVRYPPGFFGNYLVWLTKPDVLVPMPDDRVKPLVVAEHNRMDEGSSEELRDHPGARGEHPLGAPAPGHR